jgi:hypothetical protein
MIHQNVFYLEPNMAIGFMIGREAHAAYPRENRGWAVFLFRRKPDKSRRGEALQKSEARRKREHPGRKRTQG